MTEKQKFDSLFFLIVIAIFTIPDSKLFPFFIINLSTWDLQINT